MPHPRKTIRLLLTFYRNFLLASMIITGFCIRLYWMFGLTAFFGIFWCKVISLGITWYFVDSNKKQEYYYYLNLGISKPLLWATTLSFDLFFFILLIILTSYLQ